MIKDPAVRAIVNGGTGRFLTRRQRVERYVLWFLVAGFVLLVGGVVIVKSATDRANASIKSQCAFYYGAVLASGPTVPPTTTKVGLSILAGARVAYSGLHCSLGPVPDAAPSVAAVEVGFDSLLGVH